MKGSLINLKYGISIIENHIEPGSGHVYMNDDGMYIDGDWLDVMSDKEVEWLESHGWELLTGKWGNEWLFR